jgi:hypothetical protein
MTRFTLLAFAMFTSACATDIDANLEGTTDEFRASLEDTDASTERSSIKRNQRMVRAVMSQYGPLAEQYNCDVISVVVGSWADRSRAIRAELLNTRGHRDALLKASMRTTNQHGGMILGETFKSRLNGSEYQLRGMFDGNAIEADFLAESVQGGEADYQMFADWAPKGSGGTLKGVIANCG